MMARNSKSGKNEEEQSPIIRIMEGTSGETGERFFHSLVRNLAIILNTSGAWVTEYLENEGRLRAFAFWLNGKWVENYEYDIHGTPCEPVIKDVCRVHLPERVVELYPEDPDLRSLKAVSYLGEPLLDRTGKVIGHLAILDTKPMPADPDCLAIFRIFSARASAELMRMRAEKSIREREVKLRRLFDSAMDGIAEFDQSLNITQLNPAAGKILELEGRNITGRPLTDFTAENEKARLMILARRLTSYQDGEKYLWIPNGITLLSVKGRRITTEATLSLSEINGEQFFTLIFRSIIDRLEAEEKLQNLRTETEYLREELRSVTLSGELKGRSESLKKIINEIRQVAPTDSTVLILGETGTGKELVARAIHTQSRRRNKPLVKVNCAAIPANLIESEFFGHEKGAFTGAAYKRDGRFRMADGGTIFLDEIGELTPEIQSKLLRVLQEGEYEPVGSSKTLKTDVRVIAATNRDLKKEATEGRFREDLYYRLNVFPVIVPPLRERKEDIIELAEDFIEKFSVSMGKTIEPLSEDMRQRLVSYNWPGNVRELQNVIERSVITLESGVLNFDSSLPAFTVNFGNSQQNAADDRITDRIRTADEMKQFERENILLALEKTNWKVSGKNGAAELLGIPPTTLSSRMKALNISQPQ